MSLEQMLNQPVTVVNAPDTSADEYGDESPDWDHAVETPERGWVQQLSSTEILVVDDRVIADCRVFLFPDSVVTEYSRLRVGGDVFEVVGRPDLQLTPRGPHHIEARLKLVEG